MPSLPKALHPAALELSQEELGQRIARLRKAASLTQQELADNIGVNRTMVTDYEGGRVRLYDEMLARLSIALDTTTDEILGLKASLSTKPNLDLKIMKRAKKIERLQPFDQKALLKNIDMYLKGAGIDSSDE